MHPYLHTSGNYSHQLTTSATLNCRQFDFRKSLAHLLIDKSKNCSLSVQSGLIPAYNNLFDFKRLRKSLVVCSKCSNVVQIGIFDPDAYLIPPLY